MIIGAFVAGLIGLPGSLAAASSPTGDVKAERAESQHLREVRDRLESQRAWQRALRGQARALVAEVAALREQRERVSAALRTDRQHALFLEQRLDQLVPRLLARVAEVRERQARAAAALAELASKSRRVQLDSTMRARMLAISPLMLKRLRSLEIGLGSLHGRPQRMMQRHSQIVRRLTDLTTAGRQLSGELEQKRRLRQAALARLHKLDAHVRLLDDEQARLARGLRHAEAAIATRAEPQADQPALAGLTGVRETRLQGAAVAKGALERRIRLAGVAQAQYHSASQVLAAVSDDAAGRANRADEARLPTVPTPIRPLTVALRSDSPEVWPRASHQVISRATPLHAVLGPGSGRSGIGADTTHGDRGAAPPLPVSEELRRRSLVVRGRPEMAILAAPGQGIAAPVDGKVVFAERFKSYGLLLIIEHEREYHTLLWGFARLDVGLGDHVRLGQIVGIMDAKGDNSPVLHVERRRNGRPVNLAASSSGIQG